MTTPRPSLRYLAIATETAKMTVDVAAEAATRRIGVAQRLATLWMRPYASAEMAAVLIENFDRASESATALAGEARETIDATQRFGEAMAQQAVRVQDAYLDALRGIFDIGASNLSFVTHATSAQIDDVAKRFADFSTMTAGRSSVN